MTKSDSKLDSFRDRHQRCTLDQQISVRLSDEVLRRVDKISGLLGWSRAQTIKALVDDGLKWLER